jgi:hypothetical protein
MRQQTIKRDAAKANHNSQIREQLHLLVKPRRAVAQLLRCRLVSRRRASRHRRDPKPAQLHPIVARNGFRLRREPRLMQHRKQKVARSIASEWPPRAIRSMRSGRQSQSHHACLRIAERWHRPSPILPVHIGPSPRPRHFSAMRAQPGAKLARNDSGIQHCKSCGLRHREILRRGAGAYGKLGAEEFAP